MMFRWSRSNGLTLIEALISVSVLAVLIAMGTVGIKLTNKLSKRKMVSEIERDAQITLFMISKDVRNANAIISVASDGLSLELRSYNFDNGYDVEAVPNLFEGTNISTITYTYVNPSNDLSYLKRTVEQSGVLLREKHFLIGQLTPDNPETTGLVEGVFTPPVGAEPPYRSVLTTLRVGHGLLEDNPLFYTAQATIRGQKDD